MYGSSVVVDEEEEEDDDESDRHPLSRVPGMGDIDERVSMEWCMNEASWFRYEDIDRLIWCGEWKVDDVSDVDVDECMNNGDQSCVSMTMTAK
jgi:hypothetical protein